MQPNWLRNFSSLALSLWSAVFCILQMQIIVEAKMSVADYAELKLYELRDLFLAPEVCPHCQVFGCLDYLGFIKDTSALSRVVCRA